MGKRHKPEEIVVKLRSGGCSDITGQHGGGCDPPDRRYRDHILPLAQRVRRAPDETKFVGSKILSKRMHGFVERCRI